MESPSTQAVRAVPPNITMPTSSTCGNCRPAGIHITTAAAEPIRQIASPAADSRRGRYAASVYSSTTIARSAAEPPLPNKTSPAPPVTETANAITGFARRNATGTTMISMTGSTGQGRLMIWAIPASISTAASTPSTSSGWRRSQAYRTDTAPAYSRPARLRQQPGVQCGLRGPARAIRLDPVTAAAGLLGHDLGQLVVGEVRGGAVIARDAGRQAAVRDQRLIQRSPAR